MFKKVSGILSFRMFYMDAGRETDLPLAIVAMEKGREERKRERI